MYQYMYMYITQLHVRGIFSRSISSNDAKDAKDVLLRLHVIPIVI